MEEKLSLIHDRYSQRDFPAPQFHFVTGTGEFRAGSRRPFLAASIGKVLTATLTRILTGSLGIPLSTPVGNILDELDVPTVPGVDPRRDITLDHLLCHASGLPDYVAPPPGHVAPTMPAAAISDPGRRWTPDQILAGVRSLPAVGRPGERYGYADTNYVLLGQVIEELSGLPFHKAMHTHILRPAGMTDSWYPHTTADQGELASMECEPAWIGDTDVSRLPCMSLDWAGGGVVTTTDDLVRFQQAFHSGAFLTTEDHADVMRPRWAMSPGIQYGSGMVTLRVREIGPRTIRPLPDGVGGMGMFASHMMFYPSLDAHIILNFHATSEVSKSLRAHREILQALM